MLSKSDEDILNERLKNWGRWICDGKRIGPNIIYRMMKLYGERDKDDAPPEPEEPKIEVDGADAVLVNRAWQGLPESPLRYKTAKWVLVAHYGYPDMSIGHACRLLRIRRQKDYEELLQTAKYMIFNRLVQHASRELQANP